MEPVTITINQQEVSCYAGMTILEVAREAGIDIPTLCDDPDLEPVGACRLCLVENEETGALLASCVTAVNPGMVINTNSPRVLDHRKNLVKLLLASHPEACLICDKGNHCRLRQIATDLGVGFNELERIPRSAAIEELNPFIVRDTSKCVVCGKCIRACQEIVVEGAVDYYERGFIIKAATFYDNPLEKSECTFCGTCVALCPTGALLEKEKLYQGTGQISVNTTCSFCGCGCPVSLEIKDDQVVRALPAKGDFPNRGALCVRGSYGYDYIHSKERLTKPLIKEDGEFKEVSWEEALKAASSGLNRVKEQHGSDALAVYGSSKCTNEENYLLQRFARTILGTNNIDNGSSLYNASVREGLADTVGLSSATNTLDELEQAEVIMVVGADPEVAAPQIAYALKRAARYNQAKLILIDFQRTKLVSFAHQWLRPQPGSDLVLLNGLAQSIIEEDLVSDEGVSKIEGFAALAEELKGFSPESKQDVTGVSAQEIRKAARLYAEADKAAIVFGSGITCALNGAENVKALANLALLTGNIFGSGSGIYPVQKENNAQGACEMGALPDSLPGFELVTDAEARKKYEEKWNANVPSKLGLAMEEALGQGAEMPLKAMYIVGENPISSHSFQQQLTEEALFNLDFLVVQDLYLTETARLADVVLPAASFAEKEGSFTNLEGRIGLVQKALPGVGESLPDWEIILRLAKEMGEPLPYTSLQQVIEEISASISLYEGYYQQEEQPGGERPNWEERRKRAFQHLSGFPRFSKPVQPGQPHEKPEGYPYYLVLEPALTYFGSGTRSGNSRRLKNYYPPVSVKVSKSDAAELSLSSGDELSIKSPFSQVTAVAEVSHTIPSGTVSLPASFTGALELFSGTSGKDKKTPVRDCYVTLERVSSNG